ncbi:MAG: hypothetical protein AAF485_21560, partial [Chloroflexota bacterium]
VWSIDGNQLVIAMQQGGRTEPERRCSSSPPPREAYDVSAKRNEDGREFCYTLPPNPFWGLRQLDISAGTFEDLPNDTYSLSPTWDPLNTWRLVYDGNRGLINLDISQGTRWALTQDVNDRSPRFSPDGNHLAISYWQHDHWEIHRLNADGTGRIRLTETSLNALVQQELQGGVARSWNNAAPVWSPDGTQIAFLTDRTGQWEIWVMNKDGSNQRPLFSPDLIANLGLQYHGVNERILSWR